jgi:hypothetical protein
MSNLHVNLDEANKHTPKGFDLVGNNTFPTKDENGLSTYEERMSLPKAINFVDGTLAAPSTADGDVFVLTGSGTIHPDWGSATFDDWVRFTNSTAVKISPLAGYLCFDVTANEWKEYDGADWVVHDDTGATNLSLGPISSTAMDVNSSTGTNVTLTAADGTFAGVMPSAKFNEVEANNLKVTNATHTGEVSGSGALTAQPTIISNKITLGSLAGTEEFLINDGGVLKKVLASNVGGGDTIFTGGTMSTTSTITMANNDLRFTGGSTSFGAVIDPQSKLVLQAEGETYALRVNKSGGALNVLIRDDGAIMMQNDVTIGSFIQNAAGLFVANGTSSTRLRVDTDSGAFTFVVQKNGNVYASPNYNTNGAVGIGVSPNTSLGGNPYLKIASKGAANNILGVYKDGVATPSLFVDSSENVGIGTATPTAKLQVKGTGATSGTTALLVQNSTPAELFKITDDGSLFTVGFQGFTGTGAYTNFTIKNGIITAAS